MAKHFAAQIGDDALAERRDQVETHGAGECEHARDREHDREIAVDELDALMRKAEIDHAAHRDRHRQRRQRSAQKRDERRRRPSAVARDVGPEQGERPNLSARPRRVCRRGGSGLRRLQCGGRDFHPVRGSSLDDVHATQFLWPRSWRRSAAATMPAPMTGGNRAIGLRLVSADGVRYRAATFKDTRDKRAAGTVRISHEARNPS